MTRAFLENLKIDKATIDTVMAELGRDTEAQKEKAKAVETELASVKSQLEKAQTTIEGTKGLQDELDKLRKEAKNAGDFEKLTQELENYKTQVATQKAESEKLAKEAAEKVAALERANTVKEYLAGKKFINDITRDSIGAQLEKALSEDTARGKSMDDLLKGLTEGKGNIFADEKATPPTVATLATGANKTDALDALDKIMGVSTEGAETDGANKQ